MFQKTVFDAAGRQITLKAKELKGDRKPKIVTQNLSSQLPVFQN